MKTITRTASYHASSEKVFQYLDDLGVTGLHKTQFSAMMVGNKLNLEYLTPNHKGLGTKYPWTGKMIGLQMDFTVVVTKWLPGVEKTWETIGEAKMIIYSWYRMLLQLSRRDNLTIAKLSITYKKPLGWFLKVISFLFADWYCRWCLRNMLRDTGHSVGKDRTVY